MGHIIGSWKLYQFNLRLAHGFKLVAICVSLVLLQLGFGICMQMLTTSEAILGIYPLFLYG
jgi:hypothetical protein